MLDSLHSAELRGQIRSCQSAAIRRGRLSPRRKLGPKVRTRGMRLIVFGGLMTGIAFLLATTAGAQTEDSPVKERDEEAHETPLEQAREEAGAEEDRLRTRFEVSGGELRLSASELVAASLEPLALSMTLSRNVRSATLTITLPERWIERSKISGLRFAHVPETGRGTPGRAAASRQDRSVKLSSRTRAPATRRATRSATSACPRARTSCPTAGERTGPPRRKASPRWSSMPRSGRRRGRLGFVQAGRSRDRVQRHQRRLQRVGDVPQHGPGRQEPLPRRRQRRRRLQCLGHEQRRRILHEGVDALDSRRSGRSRARVAALCCDPMSAADSAGNIWYGGLSTSNGPGNPSRIVVNRIAPGTTTFQPQTVGLPARTTGTQDKPMMTIDNTPTQPDVRAPVRHLGRARRRRHQHRDRAVRHPPGRRSERGEVRQRRQLVGAGVGDPAPRAATSTPTSPSARRSVYAVWWDYSAANAIRGDVCAPATQNCATAAGWGTPRRSQRSMPPAARRSRSPARSWPSPAAARRPSPQVDVDISGRPRKRARVRDLERPATGSGTTRCADGLRRPA